jgi:hypothetical protein
MGKEQDTALMPIEGGEDFAERIRNAALLPPEVWNDDRIKAIKEMYAPKAKNFGQLAAFMSMAHKYDLAPETGEIWLADMGQQGIRPVTGRDAILKVARRDPKYQGHESGVVHKSDLFKIIRTESKIVVEHTITGFGDRGPLEGGYSIVRYEGRPDVMVLRAWDDYKHLHGKDNWLRYGESMLETRCIAEAHRRVVNITGLYVEGEFAEDEEAARSAESARATGGRIEALKEEIEAHGSTEEPEEGEFELVEESDAPEEPSEAEEAADEAPPAEGETAPPDTQEAEGIPAEGEISQSQRRQIYKLWRPRCSIVGVEDSKEQEALLERHIGCKLSALSFKRARTIIEYLDGNPAEVQDWVKSQIGESDTSEE